MSLLRGLPALVAFWTLNCSHLPAQKGDPGMAESPWELSLSVTDNLKLRAVLHNRTKTLQTYLYDTKLQPSDLILTASPGERIKPFDTRTRAKFDNTVYREMYRQAASESDVTLTEASINDDRSLRWGPFQFTNLAAGVYRAQVVWHSQTNRYYDPKAKRTTALKDVWLGTVTSNTVEIHVQ